MIAHVVSDERRWLSIGAASALVLHLVLAFFARTRPGSITPPPIAETAVLTEVDLPSLPEPPPAPKPEEPPPPEPVARARPERDEPPAAPARAAAVLTQAPDPNEPVDLTDGFVTGSATTYAGGKSSASGTSATAVHTVPAATGAVGGTGAPDAPARAGPDRSRRPGLAGGAEWRCPFPAEADAQQIDHAVVTIKVDVDRTGRVTNVVVAKEPGHGFGRETQRCARDKIWSPALDPDGAPVAGHTTLNVHFDR